MTEKQSAIYRIVNRISGGFYIGSSVNIHARLLKHRRELNNNIHGNPRLQHAWNKYGAEAFDFQILEYTPADMLRTKEQEYLDQSVQDERCYNIAKFVDNSNRGRQLSDEHKRKIGQANKIALQGRRPPQNAIDKLITSNRTRDYSRVSDETRQKQSAAKRGRKMPWNAYPRTEETRSKISGSKKGIPWSNARRKAQQRKADHDE